MNRSVLLYYSPKAQGQVKTFILSNDKNLLKELT